MRSTTEALAREAARLNARDWSAVSAAIAATGVPTNDGTAVADAGLKDKLRKVKADIAEAQEERTALAKAVEDAKGAFAGKDTYDTSSDEFKAAKEAVAALGSHDDRIAEMREAERGILEMLGGSSPATGRGQDRPAGDPSDPRGWASSHIFADQDIRQALEHLSTSKAKMGPMQLGEVASREALLADITGSANMRRGDYVGILPQLRRPLSVLDLLPTGTMDGNSIPYTEESGSLDTATETAEGSAKPEGAWTPTDKEATAQTIAHWQKIRKQVLADFPALQSIIDNRLRYGVLRRLEAQVLNGSGSGSNLTGILNTSGIGNVPYDAGELPVDQILEGITKVLLADAMADGIVMHPTDWAAALKLKATGGDEQYYSGGPFSVTPQVMWGLPLIPSKAIPLGTALVGDFAIGAQLFIREGVNVLISDSDQDDFIKNKVTLLGEMRAALPVWRPPAFAEVELVDPTP